MNVAAGAAGEPLAGALAALRAADLVERRGRVRDVIGLVVEATGLDAEVGEVCLIETGRDGEPVPAEVVGFRDSGTLLMPLGETGGIGPGKPVSATGETFRVPVGEAMLGRVVDAFGRPLDGPELGLAGRRPALAAPPAPLGRPRIERRLALGVRALDAFVPCGVGQRLGIFAGSGVGKSSLLGMIARSTSADVNVIALVGERGREVREFVERDLGDALERSVVVVATSDQPALVRIKAAFAATAVAEHFRDRGADVLLMMDSVTRFAMAQREVGLAIGEPPATRGYTPSVFALLPRLLERAGTSPAGSITGLYTVLVDGDDMNEPVADAVRSILDGHAVLTRELAHAGHYPAVDVLQSVSRLATEVAPAETQAAASAVRRLIAAHRDKEDLIAIGAYQAGADPTVDTAIALRGEIDAFLRQAPDERSGLDQADDGLRALAEAAAAQVPAAEPEPPADAVAFADTHPGAGGPVEPSAIPPLHLSV